MIDIIEVNQFASGEHIEKLKFDLLSEEKVAERAQEICSAIGTSYRRKKVTKDDEPTIGCVWYRKGKDGKCLHYKHHYDTSD